MSSLKPKAVEDLLRKAGRSLKGNSRRTFMAQTVETYGPGGQNWAERNLRWNRGTIRKGQQELNSGIPAYESFSNRGRKKAEEHFPNLLADIKDIVEPKCQTDPTFHTTRLYRPITAKTTRDLLIEEYGYDPATMPHLRTISRKLDALKFWPRKVTKSKPLKKIPETNDIFNQVHTINRDADENPGVLRISLDAKARIKVGPFSRGGYSRQHKKGLDHDFDPDMILGLFGFFLPEYDDTHFFFSESKITADFIVDTLESLWTQLKKTFQVNTLVLNMDNGPENNSHRTQFIKRIVDFAYGNALHVKLAYYPPYHSKYNPIERVWGRLENHWNGELLDSKEKVLGLASTMTWKGNTPAIEMVEGEYDTGAKLTKAEMRNYEQHISRHPKLDKYFVDINPVCAFSDTSIMG
ncbi:MAG: ISAzo13 family transposase [Deltaproteobacteria bacterium]|nr:ISAzo13 family transposase [Deltaproteobacteria bacterium]